MSLKINKSLVNDIIVFLLLFLSVSFVVTNDIISSPTTIAIWLATLALICWFGKFKIKASVFILTALLVFLMAVTDVIQGENLTSNIKLFYSIAVVMLFVSCVSFEEFSRSFVRVMKLLCVISIVGYALNFLIPDIFGLFRVENNSGKIFSNWIVYINYIDPNSDLPRNWGFAWEPGAFAAFICLALFLESLLPDNKITLKSLAIYMLAVVTTFSTTGILAFFYISGYLLVIEKDVPKSVKVNILILLAAVVSGIFLLKDVFFDTNTSSVFGKLTNLLNGNASDFSSASIRVNSIIKVFDAFTESPLYGWGYDGLIKQTYEYTRGMNTCTFVNWFAVYGLIFGAVMCRGVYRLCSFFAKNTFKKILLFGFIFAITISENYVHSPMMFLLVFYGYTIPSKASRLIAGKEALNRDKEFKMKFALINSVISGSTGTGVKKNYKRLTERGHKVKAFYGRNRDDSLDSEDFVFFGSKNLSRVHMLGGYFLGLNGSLSNIPTSRLIKMLDEYKPDVVWISNLHGEYVNVYRILNYLKKNKIWTVYGMPDEYAFCGKCCSAYGCDKYKTMCEKCPHLREYPKSYIFDNSKRIFKAKQKAYKGFDKIVFRSAPYVVNKAKESALLKDKEFFISDSSVDMTGIFYPRDTTKIREELAVSENTKVLLLCAPITDVLKGAEYFLEAARKCVGEDFVFINVSYGADTTNLPANFIPLPFEKDRDRLAELYSLADAYVCTSKSDAQPNACLEAMGCGTPIIGFNTSGVPFIAPNEFGTFVTPFDVDELVEAIKKQPKKTADTVKRCREYAFSRFSIETSDAVYDDFLLEMERRVDRDKLIKEESEE